jgi:hypothetical protein
MSASRFGTWRSLVAHMLGVHGVGGSNPPVPTIFPHGKSAEEQILT